MEIVGMPLETFYVWMLFAAGILTLLLILFHDVLAGFDMPDFLNPILWTAFFTVFSASGYIFEKTVSLSPLPAAGLSVLIALALVIILNIFVLIPLSSAEETLAFPESALKGRVGRVVTSVPVDGFGEVLIEANSGSMAKPAASFDNEAIPALTTVLIVDIKQGVVYVTPHISLEESY